MLSRRVLSAWAKYDRTSDDRLSLVRHSEDAAEVAGFLWDEWLPSSTRDVLAGSLSLGQARTLARFLAGTHDVGKLSPAFAIQVDALCGPMRDAGLRFPVAIDHRGDAPHSVVGFSAMQTFLTSAGLDRRTARTYAVVAGSHHGVPPTRQQSLSASDCDEKHYGDASWAASRTELIAHIADRLGATSLLDTWARTPLTVTQQVLWTGFVIMADWIASNTALFPLIERSESVLTAGNAWEQLDLPGPWTAKPPADLSELMRSRFDLPDGAQPNPMQHAVVDVARAMSEPGLLIVEATMGSGKTEAALAAAEHLAAKFGAAGVFVALPTMATSNAMFGRVKAWLTHQDADTTASVMLAHGKAHLNNDFRGLDHRSAIVDVGRDAAVSPNDSAEVIAHQWFFGRKKSMLSGFVVGTIDQLLFAGLKAKHVMLRHLALANKVVVVDEVHAADDYMRHYLVRVLEWLAAYRVPVILLSATLPGAQRVAFVEAYERGRGRTGSDSAHIAAERGYPLVTAVDSSAKLNVIPARHVTSVAIERLPADDDVLVETFRTALVDGGCVAVIRNTVRRAQDTARLLRVEFGADVILLHSRFVAQHRADIEAQLVSRLGRDGARPDRLIVVATQVIEQSLDLDFDMLVSDLAPIDLVFQRTGRLHRHRRSRPAALETPRLLLTGVTDWDAAPPNPENGSVRVYGKSRLYRSAAVLYGRAELRIPEDVPHLVQAAYSDDLVPPEAWRNEMAEADRAHVRLVEDQQDRAEAWRLGAPSLGRDLIDWLTESIRDAEDPRGYAKVRDSQEGIEVLLTQRVGESVFLLEQCGRDRIDTNFEPEPAWLARKVLNSSIRLPAELCRPERIESTITELEMGMYGGWQASRWLAGELVVELDEAGSAEVGGYRLTYDPRDGLLVERIEAA